MVHVLVKQAFPDWEEWIEAFKKNAPMRKEYGSKGAVVFYSEKNPREALIHFEWDSLDNITAYLRDPKLTDIIDAIDAGVPEMLTIAVEVEA